MMISVLDRTENMVVKEENAGNQHVLVTSMFSFHHNVSDAFPFRNTRTQDSMVKRYVLMKIA